jgi:hypothetical protein
MMRLRTFLVASGIALVAMVGLGSSTALAENTCETATGEATVGEKLEKQRLKNTLSTNLNGPERLFFSWEGGKQKFQLKLLTRVACHAGTRASTFSGGGLGSLNKEAGYSISFAIKVTSEGTTFLKAKIKHKAELIEEFEEELENSTEEIA